jgi:diaminohydroxyphosphoribosylaminopyrimidine deaminase/5-amino-6-(5-phosphoribosylamino)uracil reductase
MSLDVRWMGAALTLAARGVGRTAPNPPVGCVIVSGDEVVGRGWTQPGGRPHAEAMALAQAGEAARGATLYVTLEPCAHESPRGPACADLLAGAGIARAVIAVQDPDPRTNGAGIARLRDAGIEVTIGVAAIDARRVMAGFLMRQLKGRPHVTLKLACSIDGRIAMPDGQSRWITGEQARAHAHLERARCDVIVVGRGTIEADQPKLDVRLPGIEDRAPRRAVLTHGSAPKGWIALQAPQDIAQLENADHVLVEGGSGAAAAFLEAKLADRLLIYRAPILIGPGRDAIGSLGLGDLADAHGRWQMTDTRQLGSDRLDVYEHSDVYRNHH